MLCSRWGIGPTQLLESEDAGYVLALLRVIKGDDTPEPNDSMLDELADRMVPVGE